MEISVLKKEFQKIESFEKEHSEKEPLKKELSKIERELLKAVYRLTESGAAAQTNDIASRIGISLGAVTLCIERLSGQNLLIHRPYKGVELYPVGKLLAAAAIRRHRIVEKFLADVLGYQNDEIDQIACSFEYSLPQEVESRIYEVLGKPSECPHGYPIFDLTEQRSTERSAELSGSNLDIISLN